MFKHKIKYQNISFALIVILAIIARLIPHPANFAPIGGLALFSGANFKKKTAIIIPLTAMVISDFFLGFYSAVLYVYGSFIIIALIGSLLKNKKFPTIVSASLLSSIIFFIITNFGVWQTSMMYQKTISGLWQCYLMGLPFFRNTVLGDLFYSLTFLYGYQFLSDFINTKTAVAIRITPRERN